MQTLRVPIQRLGTSDLPLPDYFSHAAAGMDLPAAIAEPLVIPPGAFRLVPCGFAIALPAGFEAQVRPRSGLASRHGVTVLNAPGTIDADYRGEVKVLLDQPWSRGVHRRTGHAHRADGRLFGGMRDVGGDRRAAGHCARRGRFRSYGRVMARRRSRKEKAPARPGAHDSGRRPTRLPFRWHALALVACGLVVYANSFSAPFVFDDTGAIIRNPFIRHLWPLTDAVRAPVQSAVAGRPVVSLSLAISHAMGGLDPAAFRAWNIAVADHLGAVALRHTAPCLPARPWRGRPRRRRSRVCVGAHLAGASAADRARRLRHAAHRVDDGPVLSPHVLRHRAGDRGGRAIEAVDVGRDRRLCARHGLQGIDGDRAGDDAALRRRLRGALVQGGVAPAEGAVSRSRVDLAGAGRARRTGAAMAQRRVSRAASRRGRIS